MLVVMLILATALHPSIIAEPPSGSHSYVNTFVWSQPAKNCYCLNGHCVRYGALITHLNNHQSARLLDFQSELTSERYHIQHLSIQKVFSRNHPLLIWKERGWIFATTTTTTFLVCVRRNRVRLDFNCGISTNVGPTSRVVELRDENTSLRVLGTESGPYHHHRTIWLRTENQPFLRTINEQRTRSVVRDVRQITSRMNRTSRL